MKNKTLIRIAIAAGLFITLFIIARLTGMLQFYSIPTGAMEPAMKPGSRMLTTNLKKARRNDIIVFTRVAGEKEGVIEPGKIYRYISRLIAFEGETVEIKRGLAYVNGRLVDDSTRLYFPFQFDAKMTGIVSDSLSINANTDEIMPRLIVTGDGRAQVTASEAELASLKKNISFTRIPATNSDQLFFPDEKPNWSIDDYGPLKVPAGHFFYLGDNRHRSLDARFTGPLPLKNIKGIKL